MREKQSVQAIRRGVRIVNISRGKPEYPVRAKWGSPKKRIER